MDSILNKIHELLLEKGVEELERKAFIQQLQKELKGKKYGLVWENKVEKVSEKLKTHIPYLTEVEEKRLLGSPEDEIHHLLIEGDNLEALTLLQTTHKGQIDICYIDPPYNRGKNDFVYNDNYIDQEDVYRHSKWLSFMEKRLRLVYDLLTNDGVVFISIGNDEFAQLKLLCDEIFTENNVETIIWQKTDSQVDRNTNSKQIRRFKNIHEYIIVCYKDKQKACFNKMMKLPNWKKECKNPDKDIRGPWQSGIISFCEGHKNEDKTSIYYYTITTPSNKVYTRHWFVTSDEFKALDADNRIHYPKNGDGVPRLKVFQDEEKEYFMESILRGVGTSSTAKDELLDILGDRDLFETPKPTKLIKEIIRVASNKNSIVLDFFAGSGTTGQAVLELNKEDGGNRKFILCTNNEVSKDKQKKYFALNDKHFKEYSQTEEYKKRIKEPEFQSLGICQAVTYKRLENVIKGNTSSQISVNGLPANLHYYKINTIPKVNNSTDNAIEYLTKGIEIISIKENAFNRDNFKDYSILSNKDKVILVYLEPFVLGHEVVEISKKLEGYPQSQKIIYSTMTDVSIEGIEVKGYPQEILEQIERIQQILKRWEDESGEE